VPGKVERVRVLCVDRDGAVLLMKWRDPVDGHVFFEPPGGGIEPGESPREAAIRELFEETGLRPELSGATILVERDYTWAGRAHRHLEEFFFARVATAQVRLAQPTEEELVTFVGWCFVSPGAFATLDARLEPPALAAVLDALEASADERATRVELASPDTDALG
jgi:8-oxo-dGTP pyrophosphatase MutT (NUDIX family)